MDCTYRGTLRLVSLWSITQDMDAAPRAVIGIAYRDSRYSQSSSISFEDNQEVAPWRSLGLREVMTSRTVAAEPSWR